MKIVYLHGFISSPRSFKANLVLQRLEEQGRGGEFVCPQLPWRFADAARLIDETLTGLAGERLCLAGSSLGGYYALHFAERYRLPAVLINPAAVAYRTLAKHLGAQRNPYTGEEFTLTEEHIAELRALDVARISAPGRYLLLTQTGDEVLDYRDATRKLVGAHQVVIEGGDHAFSDFARYVDRVIAFADEHAALAIIPPSQAAH